MIDFTQVKLVVTDMDGTLLHSDYTLNADFFNIYNQLKDLKVNFVVASGRQYESLLNIFESIKDDIYFIAENGGNVVFEGQQLFVQEIEQNIIGEIIKIIRPLPDTELILCGVKSAYVEESCPEFEKHIAPYYPMRKIIRDFSEPLEDQIVKIAIYNNISSEDNILPYVEYLKQNYQVVVSGKHWLDISAKNSNKGLALREIQNILQVSKEETMTFGDYLNDLELLKQSYFSFAMANAHPDLKKVANFDTVSNDQDGVLKILKEVVKQKVKTL